MVLNAGDELAAQRGQLPGAVLIIEYRLIVPIQKAPVNVGAAAGAGRIGDRGEADTMSQAKSDRLGEFARDHGVVGRPQPEGGRRSDADNADVAEGVIVEA